MRAVRVHVLGGPEALQYEEIDRPVPHRGEALVRIAASGVNYLDVQYRTGRVKAAMPFVAGSEGAGIVEALGPAAEGLQVGDRVAWAMVLGSYAEYAVVPAARLVPVPAAVSLTDAAAVLLQGMTAHYLTHSTFPLQAGDTALVHAAAGGAGRLVVQFARHRGARVIATAGSDEKAAVAREAGAHEVIVYTQQDFEAEVRRLTGGRGVDVVYDSVGRDTFDGSLNCLRPRGLLALFGFSSGPVAPFDPAVLGVKGSLFLTRPGLNQHIASREELLMRAGEVLELLASGVLRLQIHRTYPLPAAAEAHADLEARRTTGKLLLGVGP